MKKELEFTDHIIKVWEEIPDKELEVGSIAFPKGIKKYFHISFSEPSIIKCFFMSGETICISQTINVKGKDEDYNPNDKEMLDIEEDDDDDDEEEDYLIFRQHTDNDGFLKFNTKI